MKNTVLARIVTGHEGGPCRWSNWWKDRLKPSGHTRLHQLCQVRHAAFGNPRTDQCPRRCVQTYDHSLGAFLEFVLTVLIHGSLRRDQSFLSFIVSIEIV
jgi:hypothetical protein